MATVAIIEVITAPSPSLHVISGIFTDQQTFKTPFSVQINGPVTQEQLRQRLVFELNSLTSFDTLKEVVKAGQAFDLTPPDVKPSDPPLVTDEQKFIIAYRIAQSALRLVDAGIIAQDDDAVITARAEAQKAYQSAFVGLG